MSVGQIRIMECWGPLFLPWGPPVALFGHRQPQQPQMGWILGEHGLTLYFRHFWGLPPTFPGVLKGPNWLPGCVWQCSTMFNQCSTHLGLLGQPMAKYGIFRQKMAIFGHKNGQNHWNLMGTRLNINQSNPRDNMDAMVFAKSNIFLTPPPLQHIVASSFLHNSCCLCSPAR